MGHARPIRSRQTADTRKAQELAHACFIQWFHLSHCGQPAFPALLAHLSTPLLTFFAEEENRQGQRGKDQIRSPCGGQRRNNRRSAQRRGQSESEPIAEANRR